jgi:hypothetical protein
LTVKKLQRPTPDKVFREVERDGIFVLIPASNAIRIDLQHRLTKEPSLNELEELSFEDGYSKIQLYLLLKEQSALSTEQIKNKVQYRKSPYISTFQHFPTSHFPTSSN